MLSSLNRIKSDILSSLTDSGFRSDMLSSLNRIKSDIFKQIQVRRVEFS